MQTSKTWLPLETKCTLPWDKWEATFYREVPTLDTNCSICMQIGTQLAQFDQSKYHCLDWLHTSWLFVMELLWLVSIGANEGMAAQIRWVISVHWSKDNTRNSFLRVNSDSRNRVLEASSSVPDMQRVWEASIGNGCYILVMNLCPVNHRESFLVDIFLLKVHKVKKKKNPHRN